MMYIDLIGDKNQQDYNKFIELLETNKCYISQDTTFFEISDYYDFPRDYKVSAVNLNDKYDVEFWYTMDLYDFVKSGLLYFYIERIGEVY